MRHNGVWAPLPILTKVGQKYWKLALKTSLSWFLIKTSYTKSVVQHGDG